MFIKLSYMSNISKRCRYRSNPKLNKNYNKSSVHTTEKNITEKPDVSTNQSIFMIEIWVSYENSMTNGYIQPKFQSETKKKDQTFREII